jgi:hypothetical protein
LLVLRRAAFLRRVRAELLADFEFFPDRLLRSILLAELAFLLVFFCTLETPL